MKCLNYQKDGKLSTIYKVIAGDTFQSIARKQYGIDQESDRIARANPGVSEPLTTGIIISIPILPDAPQNLLQQAITSRENEVAILIDGKRFRFWDGIKITLAIDSIDTVEFSAPSKADSKEFRDTFRPFSYKSVIVTVGGDPIFTGTMVPVLPVLETNKKIISIACYSLPGVLNDCMPPASSYPLESNTQGLQEIATTLALPFGIGVKLQADQGAIFDPRVAIEPTEKILSYLIKLAKQRNLIISNTERGELLIWNDIDAGNPVARLQQGKAPVLSVTPAFSPQNYYSHITGIEPAATAEPGSQLTLKNSRLEGVVRPFTFKVLDTDNADMDAAIRAKAGRMFGDLAAYTARLATWRDPGGKLWKKNTTITLLAPDAMIYTEYEFIIRSVELEQDDDTEVAILNLVIPGSFSGKIPKTLPWDDSN